MEDLAAYDSQPWDEFLFLEEDDDFPADPHFGDEIDEGDWASRNQLRSLSPSLFSATHTTGETQSATQIDGLYPLKYPPTLLDEY
jgi:hypothetical protein